MQAKKSLLIFAREPLPGHVKTRLIPAIGESAAAELYEELLYRTLSIFGNLLNIKKYLYCDSMDSDSSCCRRYADRFGFLFETQQGNDIGERMYHALNDALEHNDQAVLIGTDCPGYSDAYLEKAFALLDNHDAVIGPASDGGYVLIGIKKTHVDLFNDIPWSTSKVLSATRERFKSLGWRWAELETLHDIDVPADLIHVQHLTNNKRTIHA